jgi:hypothetical protein
MAISECPPVVRIVWLISAMVVSHQLVGYVLLGGLGLYPRRRAVAAPPATVGAMSFAVSRSCLYQVIAFP